MNEHAKRGIYWACRECGGNSTYGESGLHFHEQRHIAVGERSACVDAGIADLIEAMWVAGIATGMSCEDACPAEWSPRIWLYMAEPDAANFVSLVRGMGDRPVAGRITGDPDDDGLDSRILASHERPGDWLGEAERQTDGWRYDIAAYAFDDGPGRRFPAVGWDVHLHFPRSDYPEVLDRLRRFNATYPSSAATLDLRTVDAAVND